MLNWIKSGVILLKDTGREGQIKFANAMAAKLFNRFPMHASEVTPEDLDKRVFEKVLFPDDN